MPLMTMNAPAVAEFTEEPDAADALTIGRRIRQLRSARGMTLEELATAVERAPSQLSMIETGKREPKLTLLRAIAKALGATVDQLLEAGTLDERATLEIALERAMKGQTFRALGIEPFRIGRSLPDEALRTMLTWPLLFRPRKECGREADRMALVATVRSPLVAFLKPTGVDRPEDISRWVCDSVVRAPMAAQEIRSP